MPLPGAFATEGIKYRVMARLGAYPAALELCQCPPWTLASVPAATAAHTVGMYLWSISFVAVTRRQLASSATFVQTCMLDRTNRHSLTHQVI